MGFRYFFAGFTGMGKDNQGQPACRYDPKSESCTEPLHYCLRCGEKIIEVCEEEATFIDNSDELKKKIEV